MVFQLLRGDIRKQLACADILALCHRHQDEVLIRELLVPVLVALLELDHGVFLFGDRDGFVGAAGAEQIDLEAACRIRLPAEGVGVNADEELPVGLVGNLTAAVERHKPVVSARIDHLDAGESLLDQLPQLQGDAERHVFFPHAAHADGSVVDSPVSRVEHDDIQFPSLPLFLQSGLHLPSLLLQQHPVFRPRRPEQDQDVVRVVRAQDFGGGDFSGEAKRELDRAG